MTQPASPAGVPERLQVLEAIGTGAFGKVFLALNRASGEKLALKRLERGDPASIYRFKQEFRALADVKHHNLVRLHELFSIDGGWCFTMDYKRAMHFRIRTPRIEFNYIEARAALECAASGTAPRAQLALARTRIRELRAERHPLAEVYALTLEAGIAVSSDRGAGAEAFGQAESEYARLAMPLHRAACAWRRAECLGDQRGVSQAERQLAVLGVVNPERFSDMLAPRVPG